MRGGTVSYAELEECRHDQDWIHHRQPVPEEGAYHANPAIGDGGLCTVRLVAIGEPYLQRGRRLHWRGPPGDASTGVVRPAVAAGHAAQARSGARRRARGVHAMVWRHLAEEHAAVRTSGRPLVR